MSMKTIEEILPTHEPSTISGVQWTHAIHGRLISRRGQHDCWAAPGGCGPWAALRDYIAESHAPGTPVVMLDDNKTDGTL